MKYLFLFIIILSIGCGTSKKVAEETIHYRKTACLGKCPVFDLYVHTNGKILYKGIANVKITGEKKFEISKREVKILKEEILKLKNLAVKKKGRDLPKTIVKYKEQIFTVKHNQLEKFNELIAYLSITQ